MSLYQNDNGNWTEAKPIEPQGFLVKIEFAMRARGFKTIPNLIARWDERKLG